MFRHLSEDKRSKLSRDLEYSAKLKAHLFRDVFLETRRFLSCEFMVQVCLIACSALTHRSSFDIGGEVPTTCASFRMCITRTEVRRNCSQLGHGDLFGSKTPYLELYRHMKKWVGLPSCKCKQQD